MSELLLGRYPLIKPLVEREDFAVHISKDTTTGEKVVVKVASSSIASYQPEHECHILTRYLADCPYVPRVVDVGYDEATNRRVYVHTPLGRELALMFELLEDVLPGDAAIFRQCFLEVMGPKAAHALDAIHARGVIHRDIKPSNLVEHEGKIMFIDFGAATTDPKEPQHLMSSAYASTAVRSGQPGTFEDDWIALAYTWYALSLGSFDRYEQQVQAGTRPSLAVIATMFPFFAAKLPLH